MEVHLLDAQDTDTIQSGSWRVLLGHELPHSLLNDHQQHRQALQLILWHVLRLSLGQITNLLEPN